ncbi:MAG: flagellar basal body rod protein FlgC [bacterium]|nr:flagellar basal body rod protein FlgC [bacterium]
MSLDSVFTINGSALKAQMMRMEVIGSNIANINSTRTPEGGPYRRKDVVFRTMPTENTFADELSAASTPAARGVEVTAVIEDQTPFKQKFDPGHPDAGPDGYVKLPNVNVVSEMVNIQESARAYEANVAMIVNIKAMISKTFEIGKR